jgi:hypothetical protein
MDPQPAAHARRRDRSGAVALHAQPAAEEKYSIQQLQMQAVIRFVSLMMDC